MYVYSYDGALQATPRLSNQRLLGLTRDYVTAAREVMAIRSVNDGKSIHCCNYRTGKSLYGDKPLTHSAPISKLELDPCSPAGDQLMAFLDASRDLHLVGLPSAAVKLKAPIKIGNNSAMIRLPLNLKLIVSKASNVTSFEWSSDCSMLAFTRDDELCVVPYPPAVPDDLTLLDRFVIRQNIR